VDEFQSVVNDAFADILSEARKYKLALTIAHQYIEQMEENVRAAIFGNVGTIITFRVGPFDAEVLKTVFEPTFHPEDIVNLDKYQIYLTLMIDGAGSQPFSADTLPPIDDLPVSFKSRILDESRQRYARRRSSVEAAVNKRHEINPLPSQNQTQQKSSAREYRPAREQTERPRQSSAPRGEGTRAPIAHRPQKAPADVIRERFQKNNNVEKRGEARAVPRAPIEQVKEKEKERSALRSAISAAVGAPANNQQAKTPPSPQGQRGVPQGQKNEQKDSASVVAKSRPTHPSRETGPIKKSQTQGTHQQRENDEVSPEVLKNILRME
jgi:hypothetical protein